MEIVFHRGMFSEQNLKVSVIKRMDSFGGKVNVHWNQHENDSSFYQTLPFFSELTQHLVANVLSCIHESLNQ